MQKNKIASNHILNKKTNEIIKQYENGENIMFFCLPYFYIFAELKSVCI